MSSRTTRGVRAWKNQSPPLEEVERQNSSVRSTQIATNEREQEIKKDRECENVLPKSPARGKPIASQQSSKQPPSKSADGDTLAAVNAAIITINGLISSFVDSATQVQKISSEILTVKQGWPSLIDCDKSGFQELCSRVFQENKKLEHLQSLVKAEQHWRQFLKGHPIPSIMTLTPRKRHELCSAGRGIAASLKISGNVYSALTILKEIVEINDRDPHSALVLLRWLVRYSEWEALDKFLQADRQKKMSNLEGVDDFVNLCKDIRDFHKYPDRREQFAIKFMKMRETLSQEKEKTFALYETQILLHSALALVSKVHGIRSSNMLDPLYCTEYAYQKAETVVHGRCPSFNLDKPLAELKTKTTNTVEYLKTASAIAEYFDLLRVNVNEYVRCGILREATQYATAAMHYAIKLGFPFWITESLALLLFTRQRSEADKDTELPAIKHLICSVFPMQAEKKINNNSEETEPAHLHFPSSISGCPCHLCVETRFNPAFAFLCAKLTFLYDGNSRESIQHLVSKFNGIRSSFASSQQKLMVSEDKPRPPSFVCDEMCKLIVSFLLSNTGLTIRRNDPIRVELIEVGSKICKYSSLLCVPYRLILRALSRGVRGAPSFPWMIKHKSITAALEDLSLGSEEHGTMASGSPVQYQHFSKIKTAMRDKKEDDEEKKEFANFGHLLYHDWRSRTCEQLALNSSDPWTKAWYLSETAAVATRQGRRLIDGCMKPIGFQSVDHFKGAVMRMPTDMTIIQLLVTMSGDLYLIRVHASSTPIVVPLAREEKWSLHLDTIARAITKSDETAAAKKTAKDSVEFWEGRRRAEEMMRRTMIDLESGLLGAFAPLLLPARKLSKKGESIATSLIRPGEGGVSKDRAREMVSIAAQISFEKFKPLVECMALLEGWSKEQVDDLLELKENFEMRMNGKWIQPMAQAPYVFFVLSTDLSRAPWEAVKILEKRAHCSRLISIHQLFSYLNSFSKVPHAANPLSTFYILDPANNLRTMDRLAPVVKKVDSWKGVTGTAPDKERTQSIVTENDFFIFLGHDNGLRYLSRGALRKSRCAAVVLLMGCSSAHTIHEGRGMDGQGAVIDYSVASCPCLVGCLYAVTDGEIDRYFTTLVDEGLARHLKQEKDSSTSSLPLHLDTMAAARSRVKLPYLTGAAVVSYGIPIDIRVKREE